MPRRVLGLLGVFLITACKTTAAPPSEPPEQAAPASAPAQSRTVQLKNLCPREVRYVVHPEGEAVEDPVLTIAPGATEIVEVPAGHCIGHPGSPGGAMTEVDRGVVWFSKNCEGVGASDDPDFDPATYPSRP